MALIELGPQQAKTTYKITKDFLTKMALTTLKRVTTNTYYMGTASQQTP